MERLGNFPSYMMIAKNMETEDDVSGDFKFHPKLLDKPGSWDTTQQVVREQPD